MHGPERYLAPPEQSVTGIELCCNPHRIRQPILPKRKGIFIQRVRARPIYYIGALLNGASPLVSCWSIKDAPSHESVGEFRLG